MKTRYIFEPHDFLGSGQMIISNSFPVNGTNFGFAATVAYKIGWMHKRAILKTHLAW